MSLLIELLKSTTEEEKNQLRTYLKLKGKEKAVFDHIYNHLNESFIKSDVINNLGISSTHFDKINYVLLRKCYSVLGGEGIDLLFYLNQKLLIKHLLHEIKLLDRISLKTSSEYSNLLKAFFDFIVAVPAKYFDNQQATKFGNKLIENSNNKINVKIYVECRLLYSKLNMVRHGKPSKILLEQIEKKINELEQLLKLYTFIPEVQLWVLKSLAFYYIRIKKDADLHIHYLNKIKSLFEENLSLPVKEKIVNECNIASHYYDCNEFAKAQKCYKDIFNKYSYLLTNEVRHIARYIELCILLNDFKLAENIYKKKLKHFLNTKHEGYGILAGLTYIKLLVHCGKYNQAINILIESQYLNTRNIYYKYDLELRILENIIFALKDNLDFALELALKNLKYISSQGLSIKKYIHARFFRLLINVIYSVKEGIPYTAQTVRYFKEFQQGELLIYGLLLKKIKK